MERKSFAPSPKLAFKEAAALPAAEVLKTFGSDPKGLTQAEAERRAALYGPNALDAKRATAWGTFFRQFKSPMLGLLLGAAAISIFLGEVLDSVTIFVMLLANAFIGFYQEWRSEKALEKLSQHLSPRARVRRGGEMIVIPREQIVSGDIVILQPGDIAPADLRLIDDEDLTIDEETLTGESIAVQKNTAAVAGADQPFKAANVVFMLSRVVSGYGEGVVISTGGDTVIGGVAKLVVETVRVSAFEKNIALMSRFLLRTVGIVVAVVFVANVLIEGTDSIVPQLLFAVAMAVSVIPEALPAVTAITLSKGALKLAKQHVIVKRMTSIEDLGHIEVLCTDKTGTITEGRMAVAEVVAADPGKMLALALADSGEEELHDTKRPKTFGGALMAYADERVKAEFGGLARVWFEPFRPDRRRTVAVVDGAGGRTLVSMGAVEAILPLSSADAATKKEFEERVRRAGLSGRRVIVVASKSVPAKGAYDDADEKGLTLLGHIAFADPIKPSAGKAVEQAKVLGVEVKILTGDAPEVAGAVAMELGIIESISDVTSGDALAVMSDADFHQAILERRVFARMAPEQKYRVIQELQRIKTVGFLGEGINDAPALKLADVALVVESASDVAREAADIILLRKDLQVIVDGIREGRAIFTNIIKYVRYTLIGNMGNFLAIAGISLVVPYLPMLPVQILLTNLLTDLPLMAVADDAVDDEEIRKPKHFSIRELAFSALFLGLVSSTFDFIYFGFFRDTSPSVLQSGWFIFSIMTELALIYSIRTRKAFWRTVRPSRWMVRLTIAAAVITLTMPFTRFGGEVFKFSKLTTDQLILILILVVVYFAATEIVKRIYVKDFSNGNSAR